MKITQIFSWCILLSTQWGAASAQAVLQISNQTYASGQIAEVRAGDRLNTSGSVVVASGANVTFQAGDSVTLGPGFSVADGGIFKAKITANKAHYLRQTVPSQMTPGQVVPVSVTLKNNSNKTWTSAAGIKLGTQSTEDNTLWTGANRVALTNADSILPGQSKVFNFSITAPLVIGSYAFQWMMVQDGVEWFGEATPLIIIQVGVSSNVDADFDGLMDIYTMDTNGDGVPDAVDTALGLNPSQSQPESAGRSKVYSYDQLNRLQSGPGRSYELDAEGNIKR